MKIPPHSVKLNAAKRGLDGGAGTLNAGGRKMKKFSLLLAGMLCAAVLTGCCCAKGEKSECPKAECPKTEKCCPKCTCPCCKGKDCRKQCPKAECGKEKCCRKQCPKTAAQCPKSGCADKK